MKRFILLCMSTASVAGFHSAGFADASLEWCNEHSSISGVLRHSIVTHPANGSENPIYWIELSSPAKIKPGCDMTTVTTGEIQLIVDNSKVEGREGQQVTATGMLLPSSTPIDVKPAVLVIRDTPIKFH
ncbi:hypothetical protein FQZ97_892310 [compost metagenome]